MKGKVRSREKLCPDGHGRLAVAEEMDIRCPVCNYRPKTFYLDLFWDGGQHRISRNKDGDILSSYRQAHRLLEVIRAEIDGRTFVPSRYLPKQIEEFKGSTLIPKWLLTKLDKAPTTLREYRRYTETYFLPFFGKMDLRDLRSGHAEDFYLGLQERQKELERSVISPKTEKNILTAFRNLCTWLYRREVITRIPEIPEIAVADPTIQCISREDQMKAVEKMKPNHRPFFSFLVYHPVRTGEARALRRKHFNLDDMTVHISDAWSLKEIRCRKSRKDYYLPISQHFDLTILRDKLPEAFVFINEAGRPYKAENIRRIWHRACKRAGVPHIKLYNGTRHSTLTDALKKSGNMYIVSKLAGHSSQKMTEKYAKHDVEILRGKTDNVVSIVSKVEVNDRS
jgi:integrase